MKTIILIFALSIATIASKGQYTNNFKFEDNKLIWQIVVNSDKTIEEINKALLISGNFADIAKQQNSITGTIKPFKIDYKLIGKNALNCPMYISYYDYTCFVFIEFKENKYRITASNFQMILSTQAPMPKTDNLETYAIKKGQLKPAFNDGEYIYFESNLINKFNFNQKSENW